MFTKNISSYQSQVKSQVSTKLVFHKSVMNARFHLSNNHPSTFLFSSNFKYLSSFINNISLLESLS
ncbi:hypothetical protein HOF65_02875 [bacterium]|nr:hypothetical protein [bacterium]MBT3852941.1 hypothetical protein [bacterium]MBT6778722.1 hypothetical protein [bacterium]